MSFFRPIFFPKEFHCTYHFTGEPIEIIVIATSVDDARRTASVLYGISEREAKQIKVKKVSSKV
jgi:hypothetical protein